MSGKSVSAVLRPDLAFTAVMRNPSRFRILLLFCGAISLFAGLCGGLWRLGWVAPHGASLASLHGPLMVSGLFGTLISLERAVAINRIWPYLGPVFAVLGSLLLITGAPPEIAAAAYLTASAVLVLASLWIARQQPALFTGTMLFGAIAWFAGNLLWLTGNAVTELVGWWLLFLILTIAGERLEMSRLLERKPASELLFIAAIGLLAAGARNEIASENGAILFGSGLLITMAWMFRHDIAVRTVRRPGQTRFFAICMLIGYGWLGVAGLVLLSGPLTALKFSYDLALHAVLVGFVISMVFGHALIILPAVTQWRLAYSRYLYLPLGLLHVSMLTRAAGGLGEWQWLRQLSGPLTILAMVGFILTMVIASHGARRGAVHQVRGRPGKASPSARS